MKLKNVFLFMAALFMLSACNNAASPEIVATVLQSEEVIVSEITPQQLKPLDTLLINDGQFSYSLNRNEPVFLLLEFPTESRIPVLVKPGETISLTINDTVEYGTFESTGSASLKRMAAQRDLFVETAVFFDSINYVNAMYADSNSFMEKRKELNAALRQRLDVHRIVLQDLIDEDTTDLANIMAFYQSLGRIEFFDFQRDLDYYIKVDNGLQSVYPENEHSQYFHKKLADYKEAIQRQQDVKAAAKEVVEGVMAPDIALENPEGNVYNLSDLKGQVVLIDFWASWCGPCRRSNPDLVDMYSRLHNNGFEIFSVSLDGVPQQANAKNDWRFAIEKDSLYWPYHVSDLKGYNSSVVSKYGFEGIPFTVLLDRDGKIVARNLRGEALEQKIMELL